MGHCEESGNQYVLNLPFEAEQQPLPEKLFTWEDVDLLETTAWTPGDALRAVERVEALLQHWTSLGKGDGYHGTALRRALYEKEET